METNIQKLASQHTLHQRELATNTPNNNKTPRQRTTEPIRMLLSPNKPTTKKPATAEVVGSKGEAFE